MTALSILIPSRNELFLSRTIEDILEHIEADTEIIAVLDGAWAEPRIEDHERVTLVYHPVSVGQRAATNEAARIARGEYVMKCDAHCSFGQGFDRILLEDIQPDWTMVPVMRNLWVFDWVCPDGHRRYQGPSGPCEECGKPTEREMVWIAKTNPQSTSYCFDSTPHFQYFGEYKSRDLTETMSLQGSCWMLSKEKYFELDVCDESWGSWGSQGIEVACKTWLSGGRVICDHRTYYAHAFRTKSGTDWGFPYKLSGNQVQRAKKCARDLFFNDKWDKQVRPLFWLLERFWPVKGWTEDDLSLLPVTSSSFSGSGDNLVPVGQVVGSMVSTVTDGTAPRLARDLGRQEVPTGAMSLPALDAADGSLTDKHMLPVKHKPQVSGIATAGIMTGVMQDGDIPPPAFGQGFNEPSIDQPVGVGYCALETDIPVAVAVTGTSPDPATFQGVVRRNLDLGKDAANLGIGQTEGFGDILAGSHAMPPLQESCRLESERASSRSDLIIPQSPTKSILYYTDNRLDASIMTACQRQLKKAGLPIISVSLQPLPFGKNIVINADRGPLTMFRQILAGLEATDADVVFLCEHDCAYHPSHFGFTPERADLFYYNNNLWKVDVESGRALFHYSNHTSQLCACRSLLLEHYRKRVAMVERDGFSRRLGFEPGTHNRKERVDDYKCSTWMSEYPNLDIRHGQNLTRTRWNRDEFRNQKYTQGWTEADEVPGWGRTAGRMDALLSEVG
jgi:glycosyltransferase involved in cell wall biosynthesis